MYVPKPTTAKASNCVSGWQNAGSVQVSCSAGQLALSMAEEKGFVLGTNIDVVATCGNSPFTQMSSCSIANAAGTTVTPTATGVEVASPEWNDQCVCSGSGRRPVIKLAVHDVIAGAACV